MGKVFVVAILTLITGAGHAADVEQGKQTATGRCASCHGQTGLSVNPLYPNLAGQHAPYLAKQLRDFQTGKRQDPIMNAMLKGVTDAAIDDLAAYYSGLK